VCKGGGRGAIDQIKANNELTSALSIVVVVENYPNLKATENSHPFRMMAGTENRIATERRCYNETKKPQRKGWSIPREHHCPGDRSTKTFLEAALARPRPGSISASNRRRATIDFSKQPDRISTMNAALVPAVCSTGQLSAVRATADRERNQTPVGPGSTSRSRREKDEQAHEPGITSGSSVNPGTDQREC
jgi:hypothetical protein